MTTFLEQYLDLLKGLPNDVSRTLNLIGMLDQRVENIRPTVEQATEEAIAMASLRKNLTPQEMLVFYQHLEMRRMKELEAFDVTMEKISLVEQLEETIMSYQERIEEDLRKFEAELGPETVQQVLDDEKSEARTEREKDRQEILGYSGSIQRSTSSNSASLADIKVRKSGQMSMEGLSGFGSAHTQNNLRFGSLGDRQSMREFIMQDEEDEDAVPMVYSAPRLPKPGEDVYCYCQMISDGEMIACDNKNCKIEWFHIQCLGLKKVPKGTWYCEECKEMMGL